MKIREDPGPECRQEWVHRWALSWTTVAGRELALTNQLSLMSGLLISEELEGCPLNVLHWSSKHRTHWPLCILSTFRKQQVLMEILRHWFGLSGMEDRPVPLGTCGVAYSSVSVGDTCACRHRGKLGWPAHRNQLTLGIELTFWSIATSSLALWITFDLLNWDGMYSWSRATSA